VGLWWWWLANKGGEQSKGATGGIEHAEQGEGEPSVHEGESENCVMFLADLCETFRWVSC